jgi:hypothetical protein
MNLGQAGYVQYEIYQFGGWGFWAFFLRASAVQILTQMATSIIQIVGGMRLTCCSRTNPSI